MTTIRDLMHRSIFQLDGAMSCSVRLSHESESDGDQAYVALKVKPKVKRPPQYKVLLLNDDFTPMDFVIYILEHFFGMSGTQAYEVMLKVHQNGVAVAGVYSHEVAETKVSQVLSFAHKNQHPLKCKMEKE